MEVSRARAAAGLIRGGSAGGRLGNNSPPLPPPPPPPPSLSYTVADMILTPTLVASSQGPGVCHSPLGDSSIRSESFVSQHVSAQLLRMIADLICVCAETHYATNQLADRSSSDISWIGSFQLCMVLSGATVSGAAFDAGCELVLSPCRELNCGETDQK